MNRALFLAVTILCSLSLGAVDPPVRPKIYSLAFTRFKAADFVKSTAFYANSLGLNRGFDDCKGISDPCFAINPYQHVELSQTGSHQAGSFLELVGFNVSDVRQMKAFLAAHGIASSEINRGPNGLRYIEVSDPEDNHLAFVELSGGDAQTDGVYQVSNRLIHAGFVVKDRAAEDHFYKDLLGFRLYWQGGMKDDEKSWVAMQVPDGSDWLEYMLNISPSADKHTLGVMNHISLGVRDIQGAKAQLLKNGWKLTEEPKLGRDGKWQLNLYDPDDTRVEFMEFTPKEKPCCSEFTAPHPKP